MENTGSSKSVWNRRKGEIKDGDEDLAKDNLINDEEEINQVIPRVQQRLGISREEARNIIRNSELM